MEVTQAAGPVLAETVATPAASERSPVQPAAAGSTRPPGAASRPERVGPQAPRTEAEHVAVLRALARSDPEAFDQRVASLLAGDGAACERIASLRVAYEEDRPGVADLCLRAVTSLPLASGPAAESVPQALVQWLGDRASREPRAREALAAIAWTRPAEVAPRLRAHAVRALVASAPEADVRLLAIRIRAEGDPDVHSAGQDALDERDRPAPHLEPSQESR
ncbi:MAG: hypothetical protein JNK02_03845 [Planctomycetes bacterium]|nr:hypothetical protein [Planctomycetota bacterium]